MTATISECSFRDVASTIGRSCHFRQPIGLAHNLSPEPHGETTMRFMLLRKADRKTEAGVLPDEKLLAVMGNFMEEMVKAGVLLAGEGLQPSAKGARVKFSGGKPQVTDGPFTPAHELLGGFCLIQVTSKEQAIDWV